MSAATVALEALRGHQAAQRVIEQLRSGSACPEALLDPFFPCGGPALRTFVRQLQMALERRDPLADEGGYADALGGTHADIESEAH